MLMLDIVLNHLKSLNDVQLADMIIALDTDPTPVDIKDIILSKINSLIDDHVSIRAHLNM